MNSRLLNYLVFFFDGPDRRVATLQETSALSIHSRKGSFLPGYPGTTIYQGVKQMEHEMSAVYFKIDPGADKVTDSERSSTRAFPMPGISAYAVANYTAPVTWTGSA